MNEFVLSAIVIQNFQRTMKKELGPVEETTWRLPNKKRNNK